jgi:hypothetical protein
LSSPTVREIAHWKGTKELALAEAWAAEDDEVSEADEALESPEEVERMACI